jgi:hypothetical protein
MKRWIVGWRESNPGRSRGESRQAVDLSPLSSYTKLEVVDPFEPRH